MTANYMRNAAIAIRRRSLSPLLLNRNRSTTSASTESHATEERFQTAFENARPYEDIPEAKGLPLIGTLLDYTPLRGFDIKNVSKLWQKRHEKYGDIYRETMPGNTVSMYCRSKEDTEAMFRFESRMPERPVLLGFKIVKDILGLNLGIINNTGEEWYIRRTVINKTLLVNKMVWKYVRAQHEVAKDYVDYISKDRNKNSELEHIHASLSRWAFEMSGVFLLEKRMGMLGDCPDPDCLEFFLCIEKHVKFIADSITGVNVKKFLQSKEGQEITRATFRIQEILTKLIAEARESGHFENSILGGIMTAEQLPEDERFSLLYDVLSGAVETTSKAVALLLYSLTVSERVQEKLRHEVQSLSDEPTGRELSNMVYMNAFIKESNRLYPLSHVYGRIFSEDIVLSGYRIPAGVEVTNTSNTTQSRNPDYFPNPDEFLPERWLDKACSPSRFSLTGSFGMGPRSCPGRQFAMQEIRLLLVEVLKRYRIEYDGEPIVSVFRETGIPSVEPRLKFIPID